MPHGGWNSCRCGVRRQMYISQKILFSYLFFENQNKINIKKIASLPPPPRLCFSLLYPHPRGSLVGTR
jgi:hypothetical protein